MSQEESGIRLYASNTRMHGRRAPDPRRRLKRPKNTLVRRIAVMNREIVMNREKREEHGV